MPINYEIGGLKDENVEQNHAGAVNENVYDTFQETEYEETEYDMPSDMGEVAENPIGSNKPKTPTSASEINVTLTDNRAPIVVLFGPSSSGKTMTMVRLARYLKKTGYTLTVERTFCTNAWEYKENADKFNTMLNSQFALAGTNYNDFLLIKVLDKYKRTVCQLLEAAGEEYFPTMIPEGYTIANVPFPAYMNAVFLSPNKKVYMFLTEPNWKTATDRNDYVDRIRFCKQQFKGRNNKYLIIHNKIDATEYMNGDSVFDKWALGQCRNEYPGLFDVFKNPHPIKSIFAPYLCDYVPFTSGVYGIKDPVTGKKSYTEGADTFPARLWQKIMDSIKG